MLFARSWMLLLIGLVLMVFSTIFAIAIPFMIVLFFTLIGAILIIVSLLFIQIRSYDGGIIHLLEDRKPKHINWLYVYGDYDIFVTPSIRQLEKHSYSKKLDQQIVDFKTYNFAGHKVRIVPEGVGHSVDLGKCLYATHAKQKWNIKTLNELRAAVSGLFNKSETEPEEKIATIEEYKEIKDANQK